ncbi:MAG TPA: NADH-quinone oxidoreductase subunit C [Candidatus Acidoferrales bacterium]|nr:NADH-quinone oxidoreductase subunit C [Candidatus Acidoferrales bacterium]
MESQENGTNPVVRKLKDWNASAVAQVIEFRGETTVVVPRQHLLAAAEFLAGEPSLRFSFLSDLSAVDRFPIEPRFEVNYHLLSIEHRLRLRLKVKLSSGDPVVHSVTGVWPTANWHERENFDLFGIHFEGHPDLRRILMPDDWEGYPLRKDYPTEGYR